MKALIFNSGLGSRLGNLTAGRPKSMVELGNGETIFHRQLRVLSSIGVSDFVVTTGPWPEQLEAVAGEFEAKGCTFEFVRNERYDQTNYIYSLWLARDFLRDQDVLMLHGDLVFDAGYVAGLLTAPGGSWGSVDPTLPVPEKDFSADVVDGEVMRVGVGISGDGLVAFQAMYRLTKEAMGIWLDEVESFVARGETGVYAENAANRVFSSMHVGAWSYSGHVLEEIDTPEDLERVSGMIRARDFADQPVFVLSEEQSELVEGCSDGCVEEAPSLGHVIEAFGLCRPLVVADGFLSRERLERILGTGDWTVFSGYNPNPKYHEVLNAIAAFRDSDCDSVVSVGGGSAIDVAKCVKLWAGMLGDGSGEDGNPRYCDANPAFSSIPHIAIPTTAGTGSESTHFAVVYVDGEKRSVAADCLQPDVAMLVPELLSGLSDYQRGGTMLDALCQAIESHWSVASSGESREYSARAIPMIIDCWERYLQGDEWAARTMHVAANLAGKAINLTTTTLAHAMSYKLTSLYGIAHGHAVALCMPFAWKTLLERGDDLVQERLREVDELVCGSSTFRGAGLDIFLEVLEVAGVAVIVQPSEEELDLLARSVNSSRMGNYPVALSERELKGAYAVILNPSSQVAQRRY